LASSSGRLILYPEAELQTTVKRLAKRHPFKAIYQAEPTPYRRNGQQKLANQQQRQQKTGAHN